MSKFHSLSIIEVKKETANTVTILFDIPDELKSEFNFIAGQYVTIKKVISANEVRRSYSICSSPDSSEIRIAVKVVPNGIFSTYATTHLNKGDQLEVSPPEGRFQLVSNMQNSLNYLGIAAGSGITPVMAMIMAALTKEPKSTFTLIYGNKTEDDIIFKNEIQSLKNSCQKRFNVQYVLSREQNPQALFGRIDQKNINYVIQNKFKNISFDKAFLCGPGGMIQTAKETLLSYGLDNSAISFELFTAQPETTSELKAPITGTCEITILVDDEETSFQMNVENTILKAALKEGIDAPHSCQGGICSSCLAKIQEGNAVMDKNTILSEEEVKDGFVLTCQAHPITEKIIIDYDAI